MIGQAINTKVHIILLSIAVYAFAIVSLYPILGSIVAVFSVLPSAMFGYYIGARIGFVVGLLFLPVNWVLLRAVGLSSTLIEFTLESSLIGSTAVALVAAGIGYVSTLNKRLKHEVMGREETQRALNELNDQLETQANQALQARSYFLTAMSHKQRTPLNASMGLSRLLLDTNLDNIQRDYVCDILRSNSESVGIINSILEYTKVESGEVEVNLNELELSSFVEEVRALVRPRATEQGIALHTEIASQVPSIILGDQKKLQIMLSNLLNNALDATQNGSITLSFNLAEATEKTDATEKQTQDVDYPADNRTILSIQISDTGDGMSPNVLANLFEPFANAYASTTRSGNGAGIGMALCKSLCDRMGGKIWVDSVLHKGTTVTMHLPFACPTKQAETTASEMVAHRRHNVESVTVESTNVGPIAEQTTNPHMNILLAEDNILNAKVALKMLEKLGHTTQWVKDGEEAINAVAENEYDLVLMDIQMPRLDGLAATQEIRKRFSEQEIPFIIALTADTTLEDFSKQKAYGFDGFIGKPVSLNMLQNTLTNIAEPQYLVPASLPNEHLKL